MNSLESRGIIDLPIDNKSDDKLKTQSYIDALAQVITTTRTPMTISIQGDWGSGKTSFVKMVLEQVKQSPNNSKFSIIEFNTWEYSKFEMDDALPTTLVCKIAEEILEATKEKKADYTNFLETTKKALYLGTNAFITSKTNGRTMDELAKFTKKTPVDIVLDLKKRIEEQIEISNKEFIIFIDDLDRLPL